MDTFRGGGRSEKSGPTFCLGRLGRPFFLGGGGVLVRLALSFSLPKKLITKKKKLTETGFLGPKLTPRRFKKRKKKKRKNLIVSHF